MSGTSQPIPRSALTLGLAGLLPFIAAAAALWVAQSGTDPAHSLLSGNQALLALAGYGAVILSFLGGIRWGHLLTDYDRVSQWGPLTLSVIPSVAGWVALLLPGAWMLPVLVAGFLLQLLGDQRAVRKQALPGWFGRLRLMLSIGAILCLLAGWAALVR